MNTTSNSVKNIGNNIIQNSDPNIISTEFVKFYYTALDQNPNNLININGEFIYKEHSEYCIQGVTLKGQNNIFARLMELHRRGSNHNINSVDIIPSGSRRINILVTGQIQLDGFNYSFTEYFHLASGKKGSGWWIQSNILRTL